MTAHDQHTDAYPNQAPQQYGTENPNYIPEDQVAPMQHDTTATHGAGPPTRPMDPSVAAGAQQHVQHDTGHSGLGEQDRTHHDLGQQDLGKQDRTQHENDSEGRLFADDELAGLRARWDAVQASFVDDPKDCVHKADGLVADLVQQLTTSFGNARSNLEEQWGRGEQASTEDLRVALKRYRSFFERLLSV
jgi:hypothetical protein